MKIYLLIDFLILMYYIINNNFTPLYLPDFIYNWLQIKENISKSDVVVKKYLLIWI